MKKKILITAVSLLVGGILLSVAGLALAGFDFKKLGSAGIETNTYEITDSFENISINVDTADVRFVKSTDGKCKLVCQEKSRQKHVATVHNDTLTIENSEDLKWYDYINIGADNQCVTLYLPESAYSSLTVITDTGDVDMPTTFTYQTALVETDTGDITWKATVIGALSLTADTGDIDVIGMGATSLLAQTNTGDIELSSLQCQTASITTDTGSIELDKVTVIGTLTLAADTGDIELSIVLCKNVSITSDTGEVECEGLLAGEKISIRTDTGDVSLRGCDGASLWIQTDTGDVRGNLLTDKHYIAKSSTGDIEVPETVGGRCEITTNTGDIYFR